MNNELKARVDKLVRKVIAEQYDVDKDNIPDGEYTVYADTAYFVNNARVNNKDDFIYWTSDVGKRIAEKWGEE